MKVVLLKLHYTELVATRLNVRRLIVAIMFISKAISYLFLITLFYSVNSTSHLVSKIKSVNTRRPIIGILTQEIRPTMEQFWRGQDSYIAASYVKFVEGAGARAVPIWIGKKQSYYEDILNKVNGVLFPGGSVNFNRASGYADAGDHIYKIVTKMNQRGDYFPILGICLGFELMTYLAASSIEHRIHCNSYKQSVPLEILPGSSKSRMFGNAPTDVLKILTTENVTANYHKYCVTRKALKDIHLENVFRVQSVNRDYNDTEFISSFEHVHLPFYGIQFHPEKNTYEWALNKNIPHGKHATKVTQYFADFFVDEAMKNNHRFPTKSEEDLSLIYNYPVTYTGLKKASFMQLYLFKKDTNE